MRTKERVHLLEARLRELEARVAQLQGDLGKAIDRNGLDQAKHKSILDALRSRIGRQLAAQADQLGTLKADLDVTHSNIQRLCCTQEGIIGIQDQHTAAFQKIFKDFRINDHPRKQQSHDSCSTVRAPH